MAKESYYFSHDYNARNDRKIAALVSKFKSSGYGIFWCACEMMHEEGGSLEMDDITYYAISKDLNEDFELVKNVIENCISKFRLFTTEDGKLHSGRVKTNLNKRLKISEIRSNAGKSSANARQNGAFVEQNPTKKGKKGKEKKESRGVNFSVDGSSVVFKDGSSQLLGMGQQRRFKEGGYEPHYITKGEIE
jgi:hypothetical protein